MKKVLCICLLLLNCLVALFAANDKPIITVLDFDTSEVAEAEMKSIINILSSGLFQTNLFTVIDVAQRETVLKELEFSMSGCTDESCMLEVGKMLSAEIIIVGHLSRLGSKIVLSAKMIETETSKTLSTADGVYRDLDDLLENIYIFRDRLALPFARTETIVEVAEPEEPESIAEEFPEEVKEEPIKSKTSIISIEQDSQKETGNPIPLEFDIPAISAAVGGAVSLGFGTYYLIASLPALFDYISAADSYDTASAENGDDFVVLYDNAESARTKVIDLNANVNSVLGISLTATGVFLGAWSTLQFFDVFEITEDAAFTILSGAAAFAVAGSTYLAVSLPLLIDYSSAKSAYDLASVENGDDVSALYDISETSRIAAEKGFANTNIIIGASLAFVGVGLGVWSTILLLDESVEDRGNEIIPSVSFIPGAESATLSFNLSF